jgi:hypothetical protein
MQKLVLLMLANRHNGHTGRCDPSIARLAKDCGLGKSTVVRILGLLEVGKLLERTRRRAEGVHASTTYALRIGVVPERDNLGPEGDNPLVPERDKGSTAAGQGVVPERDTNQEVKPGREPKEDSDSAKKERRSRVSTGTKHSNTPEVPQGIPAEPWTEYVTMRNEKRQPLTSTAARRLALKIENLRAEGHDPALLLNKATEHQWLSVYPGDDTKAPPPRLEYVELTPEEAAPQWERDFGRAGSV